MNATKTAPTRQRVAARMWEGQRRLVEAFEEVDRGGRFEASSWERPGGGGGTARVLTGGDVFERAGVNVSEVHGAEVPDAIVGHRPSTAGLPFYATGISMVLHPRNPWVPSFHANFRYFEVAGGNDWWFGGGADLTPMLGHEEDASHFHRVLRKWLDGHGEDLYGRFKEWCDRYFYLPHRKEMRGVGGVFFDDFSPGEDGGWERAFALVDDGIRALEDAYLPVVRRRRDTPFGDRERRWQLLRRGRYAEFNLLYDRGTRFGLQTNGNVEAILMSMPPHAAWEFQVEAEPDSVEARTLEMLQPRDWA
jgi:coproporphyrinogen III oxidase